MPLFQVEIIRNYWKILNNFQKSSQKQISKKICMEPQGGGGGGGGGVTARNSYYYGGGNHHGNNNGHHNFVPFQKC